MLMQFQLISLLTALNIILLLIILGMNVVSYSKMKAQYTLFIMIFTSIFLLQYLVSGYYFLTMMDFYVPDVSNHILIVTGLQTIAFASLLWMQRQ